MIKALALAGAAAMLVLACTVPAVEPPDFTLPDTDALFGTARQAVDKADSLQPLPGESPFQSQPTVTPTPDVAAAFRYPTTTPTPIDNCYGVVYPKELGFLDFLADGVVRELNGDQTLDPKPSALIGECLDITLDGYYALEGLQVVETHVGQVKGVLTFHRPEDLKRFVRKGRTIPYRSYSMTAIYGESMRAKCLLDGFDRDGGGYIIRLNGCSGPHPAQRKYEREAN